MKTIFCLTLICAAAARAQYDSTWSEFDAGNSASQSAAVAHRGVFTGWLRIAMQSPNYTMQQGHPSHPLPVAILPLLTISRSGSDVRISWPLSAASFVLQAAPALNVEAWSTVRGPYQSNSTEWFIVAPPSQPGRVYRLQSSP
jgi:hypothetical protein